MANELPARNNHTARASILIFGYGNTYNRYAGGIKAMVSGESSGHIALELQFDNRELFKKYIEKTSIPHNVNIENGKEIYTVYVSYGPGLSPIHHRDSLSNHDLDKLFSQQGLDATIDERFKPDHRSVHRILSKKITLNPTTIIHTSLAPKDAQGALQNFAVAMESLEKAKFDKIINDEEFAQGFDQLISDLKQKIYPNSNKTNDEVLRDLDRFATIGLPEREKYTIKLLDEGEQGPGFALEPMLDATRQLYDHIDDPKYDLTAHNCAHAIEGILKSSIMGDRDEVQKILSNFDPSSTDVMLGYLRTVVTLFTQPNNPVATPIGVMESLQKAEKTLSELSGHSSGPAGPSI